MIEPAIIVVRLLQYAGAAILFGSSLFFVAVAPSVWPRRLLARSAALLAFASLLAIGLQASLFAGSLDAGFTAQAIGDVVAYLDLGKAALVRSASATLAFIVVLLHGPRSATVALGALAAASLAWMGHGAATESWGFLAADVLHALVASAWLGALVGFVLILAGPSEPEQLIRALRRFSAFGVPLVAVLVLTGFANSAYTVGLDRLPDLPATPYGQLLLAKLAAFAAMLALAVRNRRLTDGLAAHPATSLARLKLSIGLETLLGIAVIALVAWLGTLEPPGLG